MPIDDVKNVEIGDWIRFSNNGRLVIGQVEYIQPEPGMTWKKVAVTDVGYVEFSQIHEVRKA